MFKAIMFVVLLFVSQNGFAVENELHYPDWFKLSILDLRDDLQDVRDAHKKYLLLFMTQQGCGFCRLHLSKNWGDPQLVRYTRKHFEVLALDVRGSRKLTDFYGKSLTEQEYASEHGFEFTPTLVFVDVDGHEVFRLPGLRPKKQFKAALQYVADGYYKKMKFKKYFASFSGQ